MTKIAKFVDHTILKADATEADIATLCEEAKESSFASVCVNPSWVKFCAEKLQNTPVKVCTVIGFPLGATTTATKVFETKEAITNGADEIDLVINIGALKDKNYSYVENEIREIVEACDGKALTKVIIETSLLTDEEKVKACQLSAKAEADFVKTSTGFSTAGASVEDVALMRKTVGEKLGVKASGGVRTIEIAEKMIEAGATRIGASSLKGI